jgi:anti-anti-sigma regulatory factor
VDSFDVERAKPFFDELLELVRQRRLLDIILALQQVDRIGSALGDLRTAAGEI